LRLDMKFARHAGVRDAVHKHLVHTGRMDARFAEVYNNLFSARQEADYGEFAQVTGDTVSQAVQSARDFVSEMKRLMGK
jgi:uncharacterized protein (UPF0332 family)